VQAEPVCDSILKGEALGFSSRELALLFPDGDALVVNGLPVVRIDQGRDECDAGRNTVRGRTVTPLGSLLPLTCPRRGVTGCNRCDALIGLSFFPAPSM